MSKSYKDRPDFVKRPKNPRFRAATDADETDWEKLYDEINEPPPINEDDPRLDDR
jgi:hypothetical protein